MGNLEEPPVATLTLTLDEGRKAVWLLRPQLASLHHLLSSFHRWDLIHCYKPPKVKASSRETLSEVHFCASPSRTRPLLELSSQKAGLCLSLPMLLCLF